jgi:hypothetical protein
VREARHRVREEFHELARPTSLVSLG